MFSIIVVVLCVALGVGLVFIVQFPSQFTSNPSLS